MELLLSDSFYSQGGSETSFRREIMKRCVFRTIAEAIIWAKSQSYRRFTGDFLKMPVYIGVPVFIRAGFPHRIYCFFTEILWGFVKGKTG